MSNALNILYTLTIHSLYTLSLTITSISLKGAVLTSSRMPKRVVDPADFLSADQPFVGEIINPSALPMYRVSEYIYILTYSPYAYYARTIH